jgi:hypothetical protein
MRSHGRRALVAELSVKEEPQKDDDWNWNADHPKKQTTAHDTILLFC